MKLIALVAAGAHLALYLSQRGHDRQVAHVLAAQAAERREWDRQRWELCTRIQVPQAAAHIPAPAVIDPQEALQMMGLTQPAGAPAEEEPDESYLVGTGPEV